MSTILKALRRLEEDDAKSRDADASSQERLVSESNDSNPQLPDSAYAAADALANAASPRTENAAESPQDGFTFDRALSLARSRAVLAVATAVGLLALTFGAISLRESGGVTLRADSAQPGSSPAASAPSRSTASPPSRSLSPSAVGRPSVPSARPSSPVAPPNAAAIAAAEVASPEAAVAPPAADSAANPAAGSTAFAASAPAAPPQKASTLKPPARSALAPAPADVTPMRSRSTTPKVAKAPRSAPKPARKASGAGAGVAGIADAAVSPTRAAAAGAAATSEAKIAEATRQQANRALPTRPRPDRLQTPAPVSSADNATDYDESIPLAKMLPMTPAPTETSTTPHQIPRYALPEATPGPLDSIASTARAAKQLTPLEQARAMESAAAAASSSASRPSPSASAPVPVPIVAPRAVVAPAIADRAKSVASSGDRDVERVDRRGLPDVRVLRTSWHPKPDRRTAKVRVDASSEVLTLREGDAVGGLVVQSISPSSVLFESGGIEIRRRVGSDR